MPQKTKILIISVSLAAGLLYFFSNPQPKNHYDYTFRVAENFLRGEIGFKEKPPSWLNEFVPFEGRWYSVFPLGSVLTMTPFALFKIFGAIREMPAALIAALSASAICMFLLLMARRRDLSREKQILLSTAILFGTWMWMNLTFAGAWQLALGFAMLGEIGAIYYTIFDRKPLLAGVFFALAFGNRTEILLTAPIFMFLLFYSSESRTRSSEPENRISDSREKITAKKKEKDKRKENNLEEQKHDQSIFQNLKSEISNLRLKINGNPQAAIRILAAFCAAPFILGVSTVIYNYVRFHSLTDFGYARIPGVLDEPWYNHGIFSVYYIPRQAYEMLFKLWENKAAFPYLVPNGFSNSILFSSPFLFLLFRRGAKDKILKYLAWAAIIILTFLLWMHGNAGGWQFGYRYAIILLPWVFLILLENSPKKITFLEWLVFIPSFLLNAYATYLFHWTEYVKP